MLSIINHNISKNMKRFMEEKAWNELKKFYFMVTKSSFLRESLSSTKNIRK